VKNGTSGCMSTTSRPGAKAGARRKQSTLHVVLELCSSSCLRIMCSKVNFVTSLRLNLTSPLQPTNSAKESVGVAGERGVVGTCARSSGC
jgi:hypothetical protein